MADEVTIPEAPATAKPATRAQARAAQAAAARTANTPAGAPAPTVDAADSDVDPRDAQIADLQAQLDQLKTLITGNAVNSVGVVQDQKSKAESVALQAEVEKGIEQRTQEAADRQFAGGKFRWRCSLADGNGHPTVVISADNEVDAGARYMSVCGINSTDKKVSVSRA